jgi:hypothetical protein
MMTNDRNDGLVNPRAHGSSRKVGSMTAKVVKTESDYENAIEELGRLMDLHPGTP